ncbi:MAG: elongation factor P maturation arginine rhamnosyltransferase EarP [Candidatus Margulisbacteria bacterium]|nr:elongation factor P maturation arginine rhamnosyltransferase EarP [Candidatus Margulisiibacteriota bacterium]
MNLINNNVDIHCHVVDNYGDAGIALRLARSYQNKYPLARISLFIDDLSLLNLLDSSINSSLEIQELENIVVIDILRARMNDFSPAPLVIQLLETPLPEVYRDKAYLNSQLIINIEGISAESWVESVHGSASYIDGVAKKHFYIPGFTEQSGGMLINQEKQKNKPFDRAYFLNEHNLAPSSDCLVGVLFNYGEEVDAMINALNKYQKKIYLFVCGEKSQRSLSQTMLPEGKLVLIYPRFYSQLEFDALLKIADFNLVRGEDSLMQAINVANTFLWQIYPQTDFAHIVKIKAFINMAEEFFEDKELFKIYKDLLLYYNGISEAKDEEIEDITYSFMDNLDKIRLNLQKLRKKVLEKGTLIERLLKFIEQI